MYTISKIVLKNKSNKKNQIEEDFIESWDLIEKFYKEYPDDSGPFTNDALKLIKEMRSCNLDKELRAGQSLWFFLLSRNRWHGLDKEPHIRITFLGKNKMDIKSNFNGEEISKESEVNYSGYLKKMINKLLEHEITLNEYEDDDLDAFFASIDND